MKRVFLSHSSKDKESYVNIVYSRLVKELGRENVILDTVDFREGQRTIEEIEKSLGTTDLFVFFCSDDSLKSDWVQKELFRANVLWEKGKLRQISPIIISESITYKDARIPEWLRKEYNLKLVTAPSRCARIIIQRMLELSFESHPKLKEKHSLFVGRNEQIKTFEERMDDFLIEKPLCIVASGVTSIGRRSLLKHCLSKCSIKDDTYVYDSISLNDNESIEDMILKLSDLGIINEKFTDDLMNKSLEDKVKILCKFVFKIQDNNDILFIEDKGAIINYEGVLAGWFYDLLKIGDFRNQLTFCIVSKFKIRNNRDSFYNKIFSFNVEELTKKERDGLLDRYLNIERLDIETSDKIFLSDLLMGYPEQVFFAVDLLKDKGIDYVRNKAYQIIDFSRTRASIVMKEFEDDKECIELLVLISKFENISISNIFKIVGREEKYIKHLDKFIVSGICEYFGALKEYIRVNEIIRDYIARNNYVIKESFKENLHVFINDVLENLDTDKYDVTDYLFSLKENLKEGKPIEEKYLVPSIYLKTMNDFYNRRKNVEVVRFADKALEKECFMDSRIVFEIRYLLCLALAKLNNEKRFFENVSKIKEAADRYFLHGFYYRQIGKFDKALEFINKSMEKRPNFSKAKREKVQIYIAMQDFQNAKDLARENYENYKENPYHIQAYFTCLVKGEKSEENQKILNDLIKALEGISSDLAKEMCLRCKAQLHAFYYESKEDAIDYINKAIECNKDIHYARIVKFDICDRFGLIDEMKEILGFFEKGELSKKYHNIRVCFKAIIKAREENVENAKMYFNENIRGFSDVAKERFLYRLSKK